MGRVSLPDSEASSLPRPEPEHPQLPERSASCRPATKTPTVHRRKNLLSFLACSFILQVIEQILHLTRAMQWAIMTRQPSAGALHQRFQEKQSLLTLDLISRPLTRDIWSL